MIYLEATVTLVFVFLIGAMCGIAFSKRLIRKAIQRADICSDDRRFVNDILGIPND